MRSKSSWPDWVLLLLLLLSVVLPLVSWILSAFGLPIRSLLSNEGWRWMFWHATDDVASHPLLLFAGLLTAIGAVRRSGLNHADRVRHREALLSSAIAAALIVLALLLGALHPQSPLLGITGQLVPSPFLYGLPSVLVLGVLLVAIVFGVVSRSIHSVAGFCQLFTYGISHYARFLVIGLLISFLTNCLTYIF